VRTLVRALETGETILTAGLVLQQLLQGFSGPKDRTAIIDRFAGAAAVDSRPADHVEAAELRNHCRRRGVQVGTIDALLACLCIRNDLTMLTTDQDFHRVARFSALKLWTA
jgi:predicted nucleic acid-binding protein